MTQKAISILAAAFMLVGCTPVRRMGGLIKTTALATTAIAAEGVLNGLFDSDESFTEKLRREEQERNLQWQQYWRENPDAKPEMTEAYADN